MEVKTNNAKEEIISGLIKYLSQIENADQIRAVFFEMYRLKFSADEIDYVLKNAEIKEETLDKIIESEEKGQGRKGF